jgi:hypothetical protein
VGVCSVGVTSVTRVLRGGNVGGCYVGATRMLRVLSLSREGWHHSEAQCPLQVALLRQAEDRAHRKGQVNCVNVYFLCAKGTCDDRRRVQPGWEVLVSALWPRFCLFGCCLFVLFVWLLFCLVAVCPASFGGFA